MPTAIRCPRERLTATGTNCSIKRLESPLHGASPLWVRWRFFSWWTRLSACVSRPKMKLQGLTSRNMEKKATTLAPDQTCCPLEQRGGFTFRNQYNFRQECRDGFPADCG